MPLTSEEKSTIENNLLLFAANCEIEKLNDLLDRYLEFFESKELDINFVSKSGLTTLQFLIANGEIETSSKIIKLGADYSIKTDLGSNLAHIATTAPDEKAIDTINFCLELDGINVTDAGSIGETLLHKSISNPRLVEFLLRYIDPNIKDFNGATPVHVACSGLADIDYYPSYSESLRILCNNGGKRYADFDGKFPEEYALYEDLSDVDTALRIIQEASSSKTEIAALGEASAAMEDDEG